MSYKSSIIDTEDLRGKNFDELFESWDKIPENKGLFEKECKPYGARVKIIRKKDLEKLESQDSNRIFLQFLEILRRHVVSDRPNAFNKIFNLFLCKIVDEDQRHEDEVVHFRYDSTVRNMRICRNVFTTHINKE